MPTVQTPILSHIYALRGAQMSYVFFNPAHTPGLSAPGHAVNMKIKYVLGSMLGPLPVLLYAVTTLAGVLYALELGLRCLIP